MYLHLLCNNLGFINFSKLLYLLADVGISAVTEHSCFASQRVSFWGNSSSGGASLTSLPSLLDRG